MVTKRIIFGPLDRLLDRTSDRREGRIEKQTWHQHGFVSYPLHVARMGTAVVRILAELSIEILLRDSLGVEIARKWRYVPDIGVVYQSCKFNRPSLEIIQDLSNK